MPLLRQFWDLPWRWLVRVSMVFAAATLAPDSHTVRFILSVLAALRAGDCLLVKASNAGVIVTHPLFVLGASFLLGGLRHYVQE
jgi:Ca2+/H+ antiporter